MSNDDFDSLSEDKWIDQVCDAFERSWLDQRQAEIEPHLANVTEDNRRRLLLQLIGIDIEYRRRFGNPLTAEEYVVRFPELPLASVATLFENTADLPNAVSKTVVPKTDRPGDTGAFANIERKENVAPKTIHYFGDYELLEMVARGGMGTVYRARQISLNRIVAIKMINSGQFASTSEVRRFYSEAEAAASLDHPNIVPVYEVGEYKGDHFFSMAFVDGKNLSELLSQGPMKPEDAATLLGSVAHAVQYAHDQGVIHRDLKPSNVLLERDGRPRVTDFGLAKRITDETGFTVSGDVLGTPSYMPPEQAAGKINAIGFRSDVYSLGAVLYTCLSGRPPFQSSSHLETLRQVIDSEPVLLRQLNSVIPRDLETITHKCLEKSVAARYDSPKAFAEDLDRFLSGNPIAARPISSLERGIRWSRKHPAQVLNIIGLMLICVGALAGWLFIRAREKEVAAVENAASLLEQLNVADVTELPRIVQQVRAESRTRKLLVAQYESAPLDSVLRNRAGISLLPFDASVVNEVCQAGLRANWNEWIWIREQLVPHREAVRKWIAGVDLTKLDDWDDVAYARFVAIADSVAFDLSESGPIAYERISASALSEIWRDPTQLSASALALSPLRSQLGSSLSKRLEYTRTDAGPDASVAASLVVELFDGEPSDLVEYGWNARSDLFPILFGKPRDSKSMQTELFKILGSTEHADTWNESNAYDRRRALAGAVLFKLGDYDSVWPLLSHQANPSVRCLMIEWIPLLESNPIFVSAKLTSLIENRPRHVEKILSNLESSSLVPNPWLFDDETSQLRALLQTIGNYPTAVAQKAMSDSFWSTITERFELDPDPGIHASCEWLLQKFKSSSVLEINKRLKDQRARRAGWFVNFSGHTMAVIQGPCQFMAGATIEDPDRKAGATIDPVDGSLELWNDDERHLKTIPRSFAIALQETRLSQFHEFDDEFHHLHNKSLGPTLKHPACRVSWHRAAAYCNWLSEQEKIPEDQWCFVADATSNEMHFASGYLHRTGYRLPTEAEWEYVCRAGTTTRRYFGETDELLNQYTWHLLNSRERILSLPGNLKPNEFGLFDSLGNVMEWCLDEFDLRNVETRFKGNDIEGELKSNLDRILRGGSIYTFSEDLRASEYSNFRPSYRDGNIGFRIAKTIASFQESNSP